MPKTRSAPDRVPELKQGKYSDGHPLDEAQYLECKLILKPDRFTAAAASSNLASCCRAWPDLCSAR